MNQAEGAGRTVDEAIEHALRVLGAEPDEVDVEVIQEPRPALLGFGGREARVRATRKATAGEAARVFTAAVAHHMGISADVRLEESPEQITLVLQGREAEGLIGRHGRTLDSLELLVALHVQRRLGRRTQVVVDAAGYRGRHERTLIEAAQQAAARAVEGGTRVVMDPMSPRDRRTVHLALRDDPRVTTVSEGEGEDRRVVVSLGDGGDRGAQGRTSLADDPDETEDLD